MERPSRVEIIPLEIKPGKNTSFRGYIREYSPKHVIRLSQVNLSSSEKLYGFSALSGYNVARSHAIAINRYRIHRTSIRTASMEAIFIVDT